MYMMKPKILLAFVLFFVVGIPIVSAQCCINANAEAFVCICGVDYVTEDECCPPDEFVDYYSGATGEGPANQEQCSASYFVPLSSQSFIDSCADGCCCGTLLGEDIAEIRTRGQCVGDDLTFHLSTADDCSDVCGAPPPEAPPPVTLECDVYDPLSDLVIESVKGEKQLMLSWNDACASVLGLSYYTLNRQGGEGPYLEELTSNVYVDSNVLWNKEDENKYDYTITAYYSRGQPATAPSIQGSKSTGDFECWKKYGEQVFCILEPYYDDEPYASYFYIDGNVEVANRPPSGKNRAYYCDAENNLHWTGMSVPCIFPETCIVTQDAGPSCALANCGTNDPMRHIYSGYFDLGWTQGTCEVNLDDEPNYCFYDASPTTVDDCFSCNPAMSCYDYKSKEACLKDNCGAGDCEWRSIDDTDPIEVYPGVCVDTSSSNCKWCNDDGTDGMENRNAYNELFGICTYDRANALSIIDEPNFKDKCFFDGVGATSCSDSRCTLYANVDNCGFDPCRIEDMAGQEDVCKWYTGSNQCRKDADGTAGGLGDPQPDCFDPELPTGYNEECEYDFFAPNTTLIPNIYSNIYDSFNIVFKDRKTLDGPEITSMTEGDRTCILVQDNPPSLTAFSESDCISLSIEDGGSHTLLVGAELCDGANQECWSLEDYSDNTIWYISQDASKNVELEIKSSTFWYSSEQTPPKPFIDLITVGGKTRIAGETRYYTNNKQPIVNVPFMEATIIETGGAVVNSDPVVPGITSLEGGEVFEFDMPSELGDDEHAFRLLASSVENQRNQVTMFQDLEISFVVDTAPPAITDKSIQHNDILLAEDLINDGVVIEYSFNEDVEIVTATLTGQDITDTFAPGWGQDFSSPQPDLPDGRYILHIEAKDKAGNYVVDTTQFDIDAQETSIELVNPSHGVSDSFDFPLEITTDNAVDCRYSIDVEQDFDIALKLTLLEDGITHTATVTNTQVYDEKQHRLFVKCYSEVHGESQKVFPLRVDMTAPVLEAYPYPEPNAGKTILKVHSDDAVICKYGTANVFDNMIPFEDYTNIVFKGITQETITVEEPGTTTYYVTCENEAELRTMESFSVTMDPNLVLKVVDRTQPFMTGAATLAVETNKECVCIYNTDPSLPTGSDYFGPGGFLHEVELYGLPDGAYTYFVKCVSGAEQSGIIQIDFVYDNTPPDMIYVDDTNAYLPIYPEHTCNQAVRAWWETEEDDFTKIIAYNISLVDGTGAIVLNELVDPDAADTASGVNVYALNGADLNDGTEYYFEISAQNEVGLWSEIGSDSTSDGVTINSTLCEICRNVKDGCCDARSDKTCDPDCLGLDPDCLECTSYVADCCLPFPDEVCDPDCSGYRPFLDYIDCMGECGSGILDNKPCETLYNAPIFHDYPSSCIDYEQYLGGELQCSAECTIDTTGCEASPHCNDGIIHAGEQCDSIFFGAIDDCDDYNDFASGGGLPCLPNCYLDTTVCSAISKCENGIIDPGEQCDGTLDNIGYTTCTQYNSMFTSGNIKCTNCELDTSECGGVTGTCGDGIIQVGEDCDRALISDVFASVRDCTDLGFLGGTLSCSSSCNLDTTGCIGEERCGNNLVDTGETCDGGNFGHLTSTECAAYSIFFVDGTLRCDDSCQLDTLGCDEAITCGNGIIDDLEQCDGNIFLGIPNNLCTSVGGMYLDGTLSCNEDCEIDTSGCTGVPACGNGIINLGETCDSDNFGPGVDTQDCSTFSSHFTGGTLSCNVDCGIDTGSCEGREYDCGDGFIGVGEQCDITGPIFGAIDECNGYEEFIGGSFICTTDCELDTSDCESVDCGNGLLDPGEQCDKLWPIFGPINECTDFSIYTGGTLKCGAECTLDTTDCGSPAYCGDSKIDPEESCDKGMNGFPVFGSITDCSDFDEFESGSIGCSPACAFDTSTCVPVPLCGNGLIDPGETCDGDNMGGLTGSCSEYNPGYFQGGTFTCTSDCELDTSTCLGVDGVCGDPAINPGEDCDGTSFGIISRCTDYPEFIGGALTCEVDCKLDTTLCVAGPTCSNGLIDPGEECDSDNLGPLSDCISLSSAFFEGGELSCTELCKLDTSACDAKPECGNGVLNPGEECDGNEFGAVNSTNCVDIGDEYIGGNLVCTDDCDISYTQCISNGTSECTTISDGCCWGQNDGICDSDCSTNEDPDCGNCTPYVGDCCNPLADATCDLDCVFGVDPDCADSCVQMGTCENGHACLDDTVCVSNWCDNGFCAATSCGDTIENGDESDVDCGGGCDACDNGKECNRDLDCISGYCRNGICGEPSDCENGVFSDGESDVDCGGPCPGCGSGKYCITADDCVYGAQCVNSMCTLPTGISELDSDGDGIPDEWELAHGLDPNDPYDAFGDNDGDGLTNLEEYQYGTDPNNPDSDGDGYTDKEEVDAGTDPLDPSDYPERNIWWILLLILIVIIILALIGYLVYILWGDKIKKKIAVIMKKPMKPGIRQPYRPMRAPYQPRPGFRPTIRPPVKPVERRKEISKLAEEFKIGKIGEEKPTGKPATVFDKLKAIAAKEEKGGAAKPGAKPTPTKPLSAFDKLRAIAGKEEKAVKKPEAAKPGAKPTPTKPLSPFDRLRAIAAKEEEKPFEKPTPAKPVTVKIKPVVVKPKPITPITAKPTTVKLKPTIKPKPIKPAITKQIITKPKPVTVKIKPVVVKPKPITPITAKPTTVKLKPTIKPKPIKPAITRPITLKPKPKTKPRKKTTKKTTKTTTKRKPAKRKTTTRRTIAAPSINVIIKPEIKVKAPAKKKKPTLEEKITTIKKVTKGGKTTKTVKKEVKKASGDVFKKLSKLSKKK